MNDKNKKQQWKCEYCGYTQAEHQWIADAEFEHDGKYLGNQVIPGIYPTGDHAKCPGCNRLVHIDYDLDEVK
jgi:hypothetical protein